MGKEFYTFKELIMGSRNEYLKNQKYLEMLKDLSETYDKRVKDYNFLIESTSSDKHELKCKFIQELRTLEELIDHIYNKFNKYKNDELLKACIINNNQIIIKTNNGLEVNVKKQNEEKFNQIANIVLTSDFINKINFFNYYNRRNYICNVLRISEENIYLEKNDVEFSNPYFYYKVLYNAKDDAIFINCHKYYDVSEDLIEDILRFKIPAELLSDYHKDLIEKSNDAKKNIIIDVEDYATNKAKLLIENNKNKIVLRKIKNKKNNVL